MQTERRLSARRTQRADPMTESGPISRRDPEPFEFAEPPQPRCLRHLDELVEDFFASPRGSRKAGAREVLKYMLDACHAEGRPFEGWWPSFGCIQVYTYGPRGWGNASALRCVGSFFRYAFERDAVSPSELLWLLCGLENARRGTGCAGRIIDLPDTDAFHEARLCWALYEATRLAWRAGKATGQSAAAVEEMVDPLCLAGVMLAAQDGVPLRLERLEPEAFLSLALTRAAEDGGKHALRDVYFRTLPNLATALEHMAHAYAITPARAEELADELRALAGNGETEGEA